MCVAIYIQIRPFEGGTAQRGLGLFRICAVQPGQVKTCLPFAEC